MKPVAVSDIIRCLKCDGFSSASGAAYCRRIAYGARFNPWACPGDVEAYEEAANRLEAEVIGTCYLCGVPLTIKNRTLNAVYSEEGEKVCDYCNQEIAEKKGEQQ